MRMHAETAVRRGARQLTLLAAAALALALLSLAPPPAGASPSDPPGNNGTVKVAELGDMDAPPDNDPHVGCTFTVEWYGFDEGPDIYSDVTFESWAPTADAVLSVDGPSSVFVGEDPASGAGTDDGLDARQAYTLSFQGDPQPQQGYHVKLTVNTPGSIGADQKSKVFWVEGCQAPGQADLALTKTADVSHAAPGDLVTYTLRAVNSGTAVARDVVVTDVLPDGVSFVSASTECTDSNGTVTCHLGDVAAGHAATATITVRVDPLPTDVATHDHQLDVTKIESHLSVAGGDTGSATTSCPAGYLATDGSVRLDHVDQGTGTFDDAMVLRSEATADGRGWVGTVRNDTTGQLQAKVNVVCMSDHTVSGEGHSHPVVITDSLTTTQAYPAGDHELDLVCGPGTIAIAPGFSFLSGDGVVTSQPTATGRHFKIRTEHAGQVTLTTSCLRTSLGEVNGHTHQLEVTQLVGHAVVAPGAVEERSLTCRDGAKGIVAWVDYDGQPLGTDPQPVTRVFRFYNPTDAPMDVDYGLTCIDVRTSSVTPDSRDIVNTARVSTSSEDAATSDDVSSAMVTVTPTGVSAGRAGVVQGGAHPRVVLRVSADQRHTVLLSLVATHRVPGTGVRPGTVLATGVAHVRGTGQAVRLAATGTASGALRSGRVHQARLVLRSPDGSRQAQQLQLS